MIEHLFFTFIFSSIPLLLIPLINDHFNNSKFVEKKYKLLVKISTYLLLLPFVSTFSSIFHYNQYIFSFTFLFLILIQEILFINKSKNKKKIYLILSMSLYLLAFLDPLIKPYYNHGNSRVKISSVKANMHTIQTIIETYGTDWDKYPNDFEIIYEEAVLNNYWKSFKNPFTGRVRKVISLNNYLKPKTKLIEKDIFNSKELNSLFKYSLKENGGNVVYFYNENSNKYFILGLGKTSLPILDKEKIYTLTNY